ncbi:MAG: phage virion morphosis protein [Bacteroidetes bacterium]|nr:phage virion morphosis protein [Bacteroidota bacterium]
MAKTKFAFDKVIQNMERVKRELPVVLADMARKHINENFDKQSFDGKPWAPLKQSGKKTGKRNNSPMLVQSGRLKRAAVNSVKIVSWDRIVFSLDPGEAPYAAVHNQGLKAGRGTGFMMPRRQFIGDDEALKAEQRNTITGYINKIWE